LLIIIKGSNPEVCQKQGQATNFRSTHFPVNKAIPRKTTDYFSPHVEILQRPLKITSLLFYLSFKKSIDTILISMYYISCASKQYQYGGVAQLARAYGSYP
jgi:hypothetical protein